MDNQNQPNQNQDSQEQQPVAETQPVSETPPPGPIATSPEVTPPPTTPAKASGRNWKKWLLIGGIALVILLTGTAFVLSQQKDNKAVTKAEPTVTQASPTPASNVAYADPIADWNTYTNDEYGYSLKYPQKWDLSELNDYIENPNPQFPDAGAMQSICTGPNSCPFNINIFKDSLENKLSEFTRTLTDQDPSFIISTTDISNNGIAGKKIITKGSKSETPGYHHLYAKNGYVYIINATDIAGSKISDEIYSQTLQILQTFKFTQP